MAGGDDLQTSARQSKQTKARKRRRKGAVTSQARCEARQQAYRGVDAMIKRNPVHGPVFPVFG
jgi:hypothetical protein